MKPDTERTCLLLDGRDNNLTALTELLPGEEVQLNEDSESLIIRDLIPYAHKFARHYITEGEKIIKYGEIIGIAISDIPTGSHVHVHNVKGLRA